MGLFWGILWGNLCQLMWVLQTWALLTAHTAEPQTLHCCHTPTATLISLEKITPWKQAGLMEWVQWLSITFLFILLKEMKSTPSQQT